jgi:hypothetical protein
MEQVEAATPEELARIKALIDNPPAGSEIEAAKNAGFDLHLNLRALGMTPTERTAELQATVDFMFKMRAGLQK